MSIPQSFAHDMAETVKDGSNAVSLSGANSVQRSVRVDNADKDNRDSVQPILIQQVSIVQVVNKGNKQTTPRLRSGDDENIKKSIDKMYDSLINPMPENEGEEKEQVLLDYVESPDNINTITGGTIGRSLRKVTRMQTENH